MELHFITRVEAPFYDPAIRRKRGDFTPELLEAFFRGCLKFNGKKEDQRMFMCCQVKPYNDCIKRWDRQAKRTPNNIIGMTGLVFDLDCKPPLPPIDAEWFIRGYLKYQAISASSASSTKAYPRGRVVVPLLRVVTLAEYRRLVRAYVVGLGAQYPELAIDCVTALDHTTDQPNRAYYLPQTPTTGGEPWIVSAPDLPVLDPDRVLMQIPELPKRKHAPPKLNIPVDDALLDYVIRCLQSFDSSDETDRWQTSNSLANTFGVNEDEELADNERERLQALHEKARDAWITWATRAPGYSDQQASVKWEHSAKRDYVVPIGMVIKKIPAARRAANEETFKQGLIKSGFMSRQLGNR
jgi:hypothetical protein